MLTLLMVIFIFITIGLFTWNGKSFSDGKIICGIISAFITAGLLIAICCIMPNVATEYVIDNKIAMYEEENAKIEQKIDETVSNYLSYEMETLKNLKTDSTDSMTLVSIIPSLNSNTLVQKQISIYNSNKSTITDLKAKKIDLGTYKWLIYFGK